MTGNVVITKRTLQIVTCCIIITQSYGTKKKQKKQQQQTIGIVPENVGTQNLSHN